MDLQRELARLEQYGVVEKLLDMTKFPVLYSPESFTCLVPSLAMGPDGPTLASLILVSANYLCEVRLTGNQHNFDYVAKNTIRNYRFQIWDQEIKKENQASTVYQIADIALVHGNIGMQFQTSFRYAGNQREQWISLVLQAVPISLIKPEI